MAPPFGLHQALRSTNGRGFTSKWVWPRKFHARFTRNRAIGAPLLEILDPPLAIVIVFEAIELLKGPCGSGRPSLGLKYCRHLKHSQNRTVLLKKWLACRIWCQPYVERVLNIYCRKYFACLNSAVALTYNIFFITKISQFTVG